MIRSFERLSVVRLQRIVIATFALVVIASAARTQGFNVRERYTKFEYQIPMRDGVKLFTSVYVPKDSSQKYPILMQRTPYSVGPYGPDAYGGGMGPTRKYAEEGFIFVNQDVRGRYMSEGEFLDVRPHNPHKVSPHDVDESTDTYDTIDWLIKNIPNNNGNVGIWGISYPGFYASAGAIDSHPALKAASPQAPVSNWFIGDDFHHNGAFFLTDAIFFYNGFGRPRPKPSTSYPRGADMSTDDTYKFLSEMGPLPNANEKYMHNEVAFWNDLMAHPNYDEFWKARNILANLKNIKSAVLTVGGLFDAEDLWGALHTYEAIEKQNPGIKNTLVMGPWSHGGWMGPGSSLGNIGFGSNTSDYFHNEIQFPFFNYYLKGKGTADIPEALIFNTGVNTWRKFEIWPPKNAKTTSFYLQASQALSTDVPKTSVPPADTYVSDPANPVPFTTRPVPRHPNEYMIEDQRFVSSRADVLSYQTASLPADLTVAGYIDADLFVSTTGTDADFVVKVIDVYPDDAPDEGSNKMAGNQMLVRAEVMRGRFRTGFEKPVPFKPGVVSRVKWELPAICHTFRKGHRLMIQVQSSWFPLVDRNPQKFLNIYKAVDSDFQKATIGIYHTPRYASKITVGVLPN